MTIDRSRRARAARKRRKRFLAADNDLTAAQWATIRTAWGCCAYCGEVESPLQKDCVLPLSRGGRYTIENVVPACRSCNASKSNDEVTGWLRRKRLDEPAFLRRWVEIGAILRATGDADLAPDVQNQSTIVSEPPTRPTTLNPHAT
jgi:5-methylcytosine-specific restriction endonuclease McrA